MLGLIPVGALVRLFFPLVLEQLFVVMGSSLVIASAARRIGPEVKLPIIDLGPYNLLLRGAADAFDLGRCVRHLQLEPGCCECFLGLQSFVHRRPGTAGKCQKQTRRQYHQNSHMLEPFHLLPLFSRSGQNLGMLDRDPEFYYLFDSFAKLEKLMFKHNLMRLRYEA
jgi:hypothetical protein